MSEKSYEFINLPRYNVPFVRPKGSEFLLPHFIENYLDKYKDFKLRSDDVWVTGFPKSGTTWIQEITYLIINDCNLEKSRLIKLDDRSPFFDNKVKTFEVFEKLESPRLLKSHLPRQILPDELVDKCKVIYCVRNPKDVVVSLIHFIEMLEKINYNGNFEEFVNDFLEGNVIYGPWWSHIESYIHVKNVKIVHYEELKQRPIETIKSIADFLDKKLNDDQIAKIAEYCSFESMKANPSINYKRQEYKENNFYRKGVIGDWVNYFDKNLSKKFDLVIQQKLKIDIQYNYGFTQEELEAAKKTS